MMEKMSEQSLNLNHAGRPARAFITSKLTVVFILRINLLAVLAMLLTPRDENPHIQVPGAQVLVTLPSASAKEVDQLVVTPLDGILTKMTGIDHTYAIVRSSFGAVAVHSRSASPRNNSANVSDQIIAVSFKT
jgi:multidrug efflux pump subunit AcrB